MSDDDRPKTFSLHELAAGDGRFSCTRKQLAAWLLNAGIVTSRSGDLLTLTEHGRAMVREVGPGLRLEPLHPDDDTHHERSRTAFDPRNTASPARRIQLIEMRSLRRRWARSGHSGRS